MERRRPQQIAPLLRQWLRSEGLETPYNEYRAMQAWPEVVSDLVRRNTQVERIRGGILYVKVLRPALRQNLSYTRQPLVAAINEKVGSQVITGITFC